MAKARQPNINQVVADAMRLHHTGNPEAAINRVYNSFGNLNSLSHPLHAKAEASRRECRAQCRRKDPKTVEHKLRKLARDLSALVLANG